MPGTVYLVHFDRPLRHARHYLGYVSGGDDRLAARIDRHRAGDGAKLLRAIGLLGIGWRVVRTWPGGSRTFERRLKKRKRAAKLCPVCRAARGLPAVEKPRKKGGGV